MVLKSWDDLPENMKKDSVKKYYTILESKRKSLILKRIFDIICAIIILIMVTPLFIFISITIKIDSKGPAVFRQVRITQYGKRFKIFKFRTMITDAEKIGLQVTTSNDSRITKVGKILRRLKLDETPQLFNIILGDMTFVGTRPEVPKYVEQYTDEMMETLLLPAGVTSEASIQYKNEELLLRNAINADDVYINKVLSEKMEYNLKNMENYSFLGDIKIMANTLMAVI